MLFPLYNISWALSGVLFPSLSIIQNDKIRVKKIHLQVTRTIALLTFPMMAGLFVTTESFVIAIFGPQWSEMIPILRIFCVLGMAQSIVTLNGNLYLSQGRTDLQFKLGIFLKVIVIMGIVIGLRWGVTGVAIGYTVAWFITIYPAVFFAGKLVKLTFSELVKSLSSIFICATLMAVLVRVFALILPVHYSHVTCLAIQVPLGIILFWGLIHFFQIKPYLEARQLIAEKLQ
jgi:PST family polysaccharide transporter